LAVLKPAAATEAVYTLLGKARADSVWHAYAISGSNAGENECGVGNEDEGVERALEIDEGQNGGGLCS